MHVTQVLAERIARRLSDLGISERAASLEATGRPDAIRYIRTRNTMPGASRLINLATVLNTSVAYLIGSADDPAPTVYPRSNTTSTELAWEQQERIVESSGQRWGFTFCFYSEEIAPVELIDMSGNPVLINAARIYNHSIEAFEIPTVFEGWATIGIRLPVESLDPAFARGKPFVFGLGEDARIGDYCAIFLSIVGNMQEAAPVFGEALFGRLMGINDSELIISQHSPPLVFRMPKDRFVRLARGVTFEDLLTLRGKKAA